MLNTFISIIFLFFSQAQASEIIHEKEITLIVKNQNFDDTANWSAFKIMTDTLEQDIPIPEPGEEKVYTLKKFPSTVGFAEFLKNGNIAAHPVGLIDLSASSIITLAISSGQGVSVNGAGLGYPSAVISYNSEQSPEKTEMPIIKEEEPRESPKIKERVFLKNNKLLARQIHPTDESEHIRKFDPASFITFEKDGLLTDLSGRPIEANDYIYVADKNGKLYICNWNETKCHHSYILQPPQESPKYGIGKAVSCAGHINIVGGKITKLTNMSGHYRPTEEQLLLLGYDLFHRNLFAEGCTVEIYEGEDKSKVLPCSDLSTIVPEQLTKKYSIK